ncbi:MAG TPA: hypothetical protein VHV47_08890, partial [Opitutaceae bacterium]|nr:hypothetical protein [Opitutaceae bacterium]
LMQFHGVWVLFGCGERPLAAVTGLSRRQLARFRRSAICMGTGDFFVFCTRGKTGKNPSGKYSST